MQYQITATIVTYNNEINLLKNTINSFLNTSLNVRLYIVDNSEKDTLKDLQNIDSRVEYHFLDANNGFGAGHNFIMTKENKMGEFHIVLNPDIYFDKGQLEIMYNFMTKNLQVGLLMPKVVYPDGRIQTLARLLPNPTTLLIKRFVPIRRLKELLNNRYELNFGNYDKIFQVPYLSGCFMFLRSSIIKEVGVFDDRFFMYFEDVDYSRRINQKYQTIYYPRAKIVHEYHRGIYKSKKLLKASIISGIKYYLKWGIFFDFYRIKANSRTLKELDKINSTNNENINNWKE